MVCGGSTVYGPTSQTFGTKGTFSQETSGTLWMDGWTDGGETLDVDETLNGWTEARHLTEA